MLPFDEHPIGVGLPGRFYQRHDNVTPIVDSMDRLMRRQLDIFGLFDGGHRARQARAVERRRQEAEAAMDMAIRRRIEQKTRERHRLESDAAAAASEAATSAARQSACALCRLSPLCDMAPTKDGDAYVCEECGNVQGVVIIQRDRDKACAEEDDPTKRGDAWMQQGALLHVGNANVTLSAEELSRPQVRKRALEEVRGTRPMPVERRKGGGSRWKSAVSAATGLVEREAAEALLARRRDDPHTGMSDSEVTKLAQIVAELEDMFVEFAPVGNHIREHVRIRANHMFLTSLQHARICMPGPRDRRECPLYLGDLNAAIVATSVFELAVRELVRAPETIVAATVAEVEALQDRMRRSARFARSSGGGGATSQAVSTRATVRLMAQSNWDAKQPCRRPDHHTDHTVHTDDKSAVKAFPQPAASFTHLRDAALTRVMSSSTCSEGGSSSDGSSPQTSEQARLLDGVTRIFGAHHGRLTVRARRTAEEAARKLPVIETLNEDAQLVGLSMGAVAFLLLHASERMQSSPLGRSEEEEEEGGEDNATTAAADQLSSSSRALAARLGLADPDRVARGLRALRKLLARMPVSVSAAQVDAWDEF